jgi:hypothetical protein
MRKLENEKNVRISLGLDIHRRVLERRNGVSQLANELCGVLTLTGNTRREFAGVVLNILAER